jgi:hypothetical protein
MRRFDCVSAFYKIKTFFIYLVKYFRSEKKKKKIRRLIRRLEGFWSVAIRDKIISDTIDLARITTLGVPDYMYLD